MPVLPGTRIPSLEACGKCGEGCNACSRPYPTTNVVVEAERVRALPRDVGFRAAPKRGGYYRFDVVQCNHCGAEALVTYGSRIVHWRKTPRFWSGLDERMEARDAKRQRDYEEARERAKRADEMAAKRAIRLEARLARDKEIQSFLSRLRGVQPPERLGLLLSTEGKLVKASRLFEVAIADQFIKQPGWEAEVTGWSHDRGADVVLSRKRRRILIQCKRWSRKAGRREVDELAGVAQRESAERGALICTGGFTEEAVRSAHKIPRRSVLLVDRRGLNLLLTDLPKFVGHYLNRPDVDTAFDGPPVRSTPRLAPSRVAHAPPRISVGEQRLCQEALRACPLSPPPTVGQSREGFHWKRVRKVAGVRYYCLFRTGAQVHSGECRFES